MARELTADQKARAAERATRWNRANKARRREIVAKWRRANPDKIRGYCAKYGRKNPQKVRAKNARWAAQNIDRRRELMRAWTEANRLKCRAKCRRRKALRRGQTHPSNDRRLEASIYTDSVTISVETGVEHHVDHIIPLIAGGYHHHLNLQILPHNVNASKKDNPFWTRPGFKSWRDVPRELWPAQLAPQYEAILRNEQVIAA